MKTTISTIFLLLLTISNSFSQDHKDQTFVVSGKVINSETKEGISFAHVNLDDTYWGVICDSLGFFRIRVNPDQKLKVTAMGFKAQLVDVQTPGVEKELFQEIIMDQESYMLQEVQVHSFGSWNDFKEQFVKAKVPADPDASLAINFGDFTMDEYAGRAMRRQGAGISLGFGNRKKKFKGMKIPTKLEEIHTTLLSEKFNRNLVAEITKENGNRLDILMKYINSRTSFSYQSSDMYIVRRIKELHKKFLQEDTDFQNNLSFTDTLGTIENHLRP
ncbi:carboxypeptidase-like regulatory domain-containing protein [Marinifilum fragile]|uniref:carboxypeptidase-like regulatory domain-containing protein n=1 Tax=Marinifilum fragile TaxID=570161 RepID=UPI0006D04257|nr:carboxypeptidase-like regulatory domain-containing protein [Marinifilum fragile]